MFAARKKYRWIPPVLITILLAAALTFPYALAMTWSIGDADTDHTLTYVSGRLRWDAASEVGKNGELHLSMFRPDYDGISAHNDENVVAPGTEGQTHIRIQNKGDDSISYTAVLYRLDESDIPITASLTGGTPTQTHVLPSGVTAEQVGSVTGTVSGKSSKLLEIDWQWHYSVDELSDDRDTMLGTQSEGDEVEYGMYIVVTDNHTESEYVPKTGDDSNIMLWCALTLASLFAAAYFVFRCERKGKEL